MSKLFRMACPASPHEHPAAKEIVGRWGCVSDLREDGSAVQLLNEGRESQTRLARKSDMYQRFSWDALFPQYLTMFDRVLKGDAAGNEHLNKEPAT